MAEKSFMMQDILGELRAGRVRSHERPFIGWTCTYLPIEIIEAAGLHPYRTLPEPSSEKADAHLDPNFCPFVKASLGSALEGTYSFLSGTVILNTCDGMRRLYDAWRFYCAPDFTFLLDVPRIVTKGSLSRFTEELHHLVEELEKHFHLRITSNSLANSIREANATRVLLRQLISLHGAGDPPLGYADIMDILVERWKVPRTYYNKILKEFVNNLDQISESIDPYRPRVMIVGSLLESSPLLRLVEDLGACITAADICTVDRCLEEVPLSSNPVQSLGRAYLEKTPCARMYDTEARIRHILGRIEKTAADGVIYYSLKFCDPYLYEAPAVQESLRQKNIPLLFIEGDYTGRAGGRKRTRIQAFLEMLEKNARR